MHKGILPVREDSLLKRTLALSLLVIGIHIQGVRANIDTAISMARTACGNISVELSDMKKMAGINTAVTGVGTALGVGATVTGIVKSNKDKKEEEYDEIIAELEAAGAKKIETQDELLTVLAEAFMEAGDTDSVQMAMAIREKKRKVAEQSKKLGNWRTGLLAANTATNVAGAVIAGGNSIDDNLYDKIDSCVESIKNLSDARMRAHVGGEIEPEQDRIAQEIIEACRDWEFVDLSSIDDRAKGATISSGVGAGVGFVGTIVSAVANTDKTRNDNTKTGKEKEKNLNTAANVMAGGATVASGVATVFNAIQINAIKKASDAADKCEEALR